MGLFDVFLSYHWRDHEAVERLASWLRQEAGLRPFLDRWYLAPGQRWQAKLEEVLSSCRAVAVCIGAGGMGPWQQREKDLALDRQTREATFPVIPVLLPGCDPVLGFLAQNTWVDLRGGLTDQLRLRALTKAIRGEPPGADLEEEVAAAKAGICPYRGLRYFREEDAEFFFGREAASNTLAHAVARSPLVAVAGASGIGKSSVLRAGLLPLLRRGVGDRTWEMLTLVPSDSPLRQLAAALLPLLEPTMSEVDRLTEVGKLAQRLGNSASGVSLRDVARRVLDKQPGTDRLLIAVDQWEELYTLTRDDGARGRFIQELLAATAAGDPIRVVLILRGDFFGRALEHRALSDRLEGNLVHLGPMIETELREAITQPARRVGLDFEPGLPEQLLRDVAEQPGNLPLLEFALEQLWKSRQGRLLTHASYKDMGGLQGALAQRADNLLEQLSPAEREAVERIFLQLVRVGSASADTRRRAAIAEMGAPARPLLERLASERLVVTGRDDATGQETAEVAHEALIRGWKRLREWVDADRDFMLWQERLRTEVDTWRRLHTSERDAVLLRRTLLAEAEQWLARRGERLSEDEREFIQESRRHRDRSRNLRVAVGVLTLLMVASLAAWQWVAIRREATRNLVQKLSYRAGYLQDSQPEVALLFAAEAANRDPTLKSMGVLLSLLQRHRFIAPVEVPEEHELRRTLDVGIGASDVATIKAGGVVDGEKHPFADFLRPFTDSVAVTANADATILAIGHDDGRITLWDVARRKQLGAALAGKGSAIANLGFISDGTLISRDDKGSVTRWPIGVEALTERACRRAGRGHEGKLLKYLDDVGDSLACKGKYDDGQSVSPPVPDDMIAASAGWSSIRERGYDGEDEMRRVYVEAFAIDKTEVTVAAYRRCVEERACDAPEFGVGCVWPEREEKTDHAIDCIDLNRAEQYCKWLRKRLPRAEEWEKAARGTDGTDRLTHPHPWEDEARYPLTHPHPWEGEFFEYERFRKDQPQANICSDNLLHISDNVVEWVSDGARGRGQFRGGPRWQREGLGPNQPAGVLRNVGFRCAHSVPLDADPST